MFLYRKKGKKAWFRLILGSWMIGVSLFTGAASGYAEEAGQKMEVNNPANLTKENLTYTIVLDPGHGGNDTGADGWNSSEKRLNLLVAKYMKAELEKYRNVKVLMTRNKDVYVGLHERTAYAKKKKADLIISLHNDSWDSGLPYDNGSSVLVAKKGSYRPEMCTQEVRLARSILSELEGLGLVNRGLVRKKSSKVKQYEDGSKGDYHAIIRDGMIYGIPSILVEHAFCDNKHDYQNFLKNDAQLKAMGAADARGVARYLGLHRKDSGEVLEPITVKEKKQLCAADPEAYYTLARKYYYNQIYFAMMAAGSQRHDTNLNLAGKNAGGAVSDSESAEALEKEALKRASEIAEQNSAAMKKAPNVILMILGGFVLLLIIREFDFGFSFSIRVKKRGDKHDKWKKWNIQYQMDVLD